jgi:hypothetical protein
VKWPLTDRKIAQPAEPRDRVNGTIAALREQQEVFVCMRKQRHVQPQDVHIADEDQE